MWGEESEGLCQRFSLGQSIPQKRFVVDFFHILHGRADKVVFSDAEERAQGAPVLTAAVGFQRTAGSGEEQQFFRPAQAHLALGRIVER